MNNMVQGKKQTRIESDGFKLMWQPSESESTASLSFLGTFHSQLSKFQGIELLYSTEQKKKKDLYKVY